MENWPAALEWLHREPVFSVDDARFTWGDVLVAAELNGAYSQLAASTRHTLACSRIAARAGVAPAREAVRAAATRFRYERDLLSAEELQRWLSRWRLALDDWTDHLRRLLSEARVAEDGLDVAGEAVGANELAAAISVDAVCSGMLEREAARLAADAALASRSVAATVEDRRALIMEVTAEAADARRALAAATDVEREIGGRTLEWTRIDAELLEVSSDDAAREVALCVRVDGRSLADVAGEIGLPVSRRTLYLEQAQEEGFHELLGAGPGELIGPVAGDASFLLLHVLARTRPTTHDPELRQRAVEHALDHAVTRAFETRVRWA
jgi:hypothetical protein